MRDWQHWLITCYFAATDEGPSYSIRYLIKTPVIAYPYDESDQSLDALIWDERNEVEKIFREQFEKIIGHEFNAEILFIEEQDVVVFEASRPFPLEQPA